MANLDNNSQQNAPVGGANAFRQAVEGAGAPAESQDDADDDSEEDDDDEGNDSQGGNDGGDNPDGADNDSDDSDDADDDEESDDDEGDDPKPDDKKTPKSRKFSQFAGDGTDEAYLNNLENGYKNSSAEAIRLKGELDQATGRNDAIMRAIAADPELAKRLNDVVNKGGSGGGSDSSKNPADSGIDNPFVKSLENEWKEKSTQEIQEIIDANPELTSDEQLSENVKHYMNLFSTDHYNRTGKLMSGGEAMKKAMDFLGIQDKRQKQDLANGAKKNLTSPRSRGKAKKSSGSKPTFTPAQLAMAQAMGKDQAWLEKNAK